MTSGNLSPSRERRALLVLVDHWLCALLRAELIEQGKEGDCAPTLAIGLLRKSVLPDVVLIDDRRISDSDVPVLEVITEGAESVNAVLLAGRLARPRPGPWSRILRRPITFGDIVQTLVAVLDAPRTPPPFADGESASSMFTQRQVPWPAITCKACGGSRHYQAPRTEAELLTVAADEARFAMAHVPGSPRAARDAFVAGPDLLSSLENRADRAVHATSNGE